MRSCRRGIYFREDVLKMLEAYAKETGLNPSQIVNIAVETFFQTKASEHLKEAVKLQAKREKLIKEENDLFKELKAILRSAVYLEDAERDLLLGKKPGIRPSERMAGILSKMPENIREAVMRIFSRREEIANRLAEIETKILPESKRTIVLTENGYKIVPKATPLEFVTRYVVTKTLGVSYKVEKS
jgi:hypothetical protein